MHRVGCRCSFSSFVLFKCSFVICAFVFILLISGRIFFPLDFFADGVIYFDLCAITLARFLWHNHGRASVRTWQINAFGCSSIDAIIWLDLTIN